MYQRNARSLRDLLFAICYLLFDSEFGRAIAVLTMSRHTPYRPENSARKETEIKRLNALERSDARPRNKHPAQAAPR